MQLDLFGDNELMNDLKICNDLITKIIWYCNHLKNTKIVYTQKEIAEYILFLIY